MLYIAYFIIVSGHNIKKRFAKFSIFDLYRVECGASSFPQNLKLQKGPPGACSIFGVVVHSLPIMLPPCTTRKNRCAFNLSTMGAKAGVWVCKKEGQTVAQREDAGGLPMLLPIVCLLLVGVQRGSYLWQTAKWFVLLGWFLVWASSYLGKGFRPGYTSRPCESAVLLQCCCQTSSVALRQKMGCGRHLHKPANGLIPRSQPRQSGPSAVVQWWLGFLGLRWGLAGPGLDFGLW